MCQEDRFSLLQRLQKRDSGDADAEVRRFGASLDWRPLWLISSILRERASHLCSQMNTLNRNERGGRCCRTIQMAWNAFICQETTLRLRVGRLGALRCPTIAFESMPAGCGSCSRSKEGRTDRAPKILCYCSVRLHFRETGSQTTDGAEARYMQRQQLSSHLCRGTASLIRVFRSKWSTRSLSGEAVNA